MGNNISNQAITKNEDSRKRIAKRYRAEKRFKMYGIFAILLSAIFLLFLVFSVFSKSIPAFTQGIIKLEINFSGSELGIDNVTTQSAMQANFTNLARQSLLRLFPDVTTRKDKKKLYAMLSDGVEYILRDFLISKPEILNSSTTLWLPLSDDMDLLLKEYLHEEMVDNKQKQWLDILKGKQLVDSRINSSFFTSSDSNEPELAGIGGAIVGSFLTLLVTIALSLPLGVMAAIYLEEFAPNNRFSNIIEININNLAAVPSIVFGLLGAAVFLNFFGFGRTLPLVGGIVLSLMTLPTVIITTRAALKAVPPSIREAALGVGASDLQVVMHHVLPLAVPGILTGSIIGMARALGESAPLLLIGMQAFVADIDWGFMKEATVLPVQIFSWASKPEKLFLAKTSAATLVLLLFLICMNAIAVYLRKKFERRW